MLRLDCFHNQATKKMSQHTLDMSFIVMNVFPLIFIKCTVKYFKSSSVFLREYNLSDFKSGMNRNVLGKRGQMPTWYKLFNVK